VLTHSKPGTEERRGTCLGLAELATWHSGVVTRLTDRFGSLEDALAYPRPDLAKIVSPRRDAGTLQAGAGAGVRDDPIGDGRTVPDKRTEARARDLQAASEAEAWKAALARCSPSRAAQMPPGGIAVAFCESDYPAGLRDLPDPPPALFVLAGAGQRAARDGLACVRETVCVAVVGTRRPSTYGMDMAFAVARDLVRDGAAVVSGLAFGIDAAAHRGALEEAASRSSPQAGAPSRVCTVAVMAGGADVCHPRSHRTLRQHVLERGLVVSEFVWGAPVRSWRFPACNRVMASMSHCTVVVEGAVNSGALITACRARELGRPLLAVPGECGRRLTEGPHALLREGATLCDSGASVAGVFRRLAEKPGATLPEPVRRWLQYQDGRDAIAAEGVEGRQERCAIPSGLLSEDERKVMAALDAGSTDLDEVAAVTGMPSNAVLAALGALEVRGLASGGGRGTYRTVRGVAL